MRPILFILAMLAALAGAEAALARGGGHAAHGPAGHAPRPAPRRQAPVPQGWAKVGKHVYTSETWKGGNRGAWSTDVPY